MITVIEPIKRKKGMTKADFRRYYETNHVALAQKHFGHLFLDYRRIHVKSAIVVSADGEDSSQSDDGLYDALAYIVFKDEDAMKEFFRIAVQPDVREELMWDEKQFCSGDDFNLLICEEVRTWSAGNFPELGKPFGDTD